MGAANGARIERRIGGRHDAKLAIAGAFACYFVPLGESERGAGREGRTVEQFESPGTVGRVIGTPGIIRATCGQQYHTESQDNQKSHGKRASMSPTVACGRLLGIMVRVGAQCVPRPVEQRLAQDTAGDDLSLNFSSTFKNVEDAGIAEHAADLILQREAVAAVDL